MEWRRVDEETGEEGYAEAPKSKKITSNRMMIKGMKPSTCYLVKVRQVYKSDLPSKWSASQIITTLPNLQLSFGNGEQGGNEVGIGEDFLVVNWRKGLQQLMDGREGTRFEVRIVPVDESGTETGKYRLDSTSDATVKLSNLQ
eukprot:gene20117-7183_t